ncbi:PAS domain-containing protein, partial [Thermodesulfobacteriota bacterium]
MTEQGMQRVITILEAMEDGIYIINQDFVIEFINRKMIQDFGEGTGEKCFKAINQFDSICPWCRAKEVFEGQTLKWEHQVKRLDKTYALTELPLRNPDGTLSKLSICRDITRSKKREEELRATEEDYKDLFEHVGVGVYISS